jgi:uncharacterized protein with HEPN domain
MERDVRTFLWDARNAAEAILGFVAGASFEQYAGNAMLHSAVERKFEIIGEALNQVSKLDPSVASRVPDLPQIVAFRNILIHGYAVVSHERVWRIIHEALPQAIASIDGLLGESGES